MQLRIGYQEPYQPKGLQQPHEPTVWRRGIHEAVRVPEGYVSPTHPRNQIPSYAIARLFYQIQKERMRFSQMLAVRRAQTNHPIQFVCPRLFPGLKGVDVLKHGPQRLLRVAVKLVEDRK